MLKNSSTADYSWLKTKLPPHRCLCGRRYWGHEVGCMACRLRRGLERRFEWKGMIVYEKVDNI
jgi:hypothetical protein